MSNLAVWASSAVLHASLFLPSKDYTKAAIFGGIFLGLGVLSTGAKVLQHSFQNKSLENIVE